MALKTKVQLEKECIAFKKKNAELEEKFVVLEDGNKKRAGEILTQKQEIATLKEQIKTHNLDVSEVEQKEVPSRFSDYPNPFAEVEPGVMAYSVGRARDTGVVLYFPCYDHMIYLPKGNVIFVEEKKGYKLI